MEKIKALLTSKKFWTLVAAIVAALAAFFTTSCAAQAKIQREGIHIDTVRVDYIIRSKNFQTLASCQTTDQFDPTLQRSTLKFFPSTLAFGTSTVSANVTRLLAVLSSGVSTPLHPLPFASRQLSSLSAFTKSISFTTSMEIYSKLTAPSSLSVPSFTFGESYLIALVPIAFLRRSRRGGRRGKGRPKGTKSIPLGGSHL